MKSSIALTALLVLSTQTAFADDDFRPYGRFHDVRAQLFSEFKTIESVSHRERITILQEAEACIQSAANRDQYRVCEEREKAAREQSNDRARASREALRARIDQMRASYVMGRPY